MPGLRALLTGASRTSGRGFARFSPGLRALLAGASRAPCRGTALLAGAARTTCRGGHCSPGLRSLLAGAARAACLHAEARSRAGGPGLRPTTGRGYRAILAGESTSCLGCALRAGDRHSLPGIGTPCRGAGTSCRANRVSRAVVPIAARFASAAPTLCRIPSDREDRFESRSLAAFPVRHATPWQSRHGFDRPTFVACASSPPPHSTESK